jgi:hypothetical protein
MADAGVMIPAAHGHWIGSRLGRRDDQLVPDQDNVPGEGAVPGRLAGSHLL